MLPKLNEIFFVNVRMVLRSDIECKPDLPLSRHLHSSSHKLKNAIALQKLEIKIIENNPKSGERSRPQALVARNYHPLF
jgi:hypothetical protein